MQEWTESDLKWYLEVLTKNDISEIAGALSVIAEISRRPKPQPIPTGNAKIISYLEQLVEDQRLCMLIWTIPQAFGEIRWLAARLLACEYAYQGIEKSIILKDVIQPITENGIFNIAKGIQTSFTELVQHGLIPKKTEVIKPQDYADCCSKEAVERRRSQEKKE